MFAFDAHGFGRSEPLAASCRAYIGSVDHLVDDVYSFLQVPLIAHSEHHAAVQCMPRYNIFKLIKDTLMINGQMQGPCSERLYAHKVPRFTR